MSIATVGAGIARMAEENPNFNPDSVTPGVIGFIVTAVFALAVILLGWDLGRRLRRNRYREEIRESLEAELAERDAAGAGAGGAGEGDAGSGSGLPAGGADRDPGSADPELPAVPRA